MRHNAQPSAPGRTDQTRQRQTSPPRIGHVTHEPFEGLPREFEAERGVGERWEGQVGGMQAEVAKLVVDEEFGELQLALECQLCKEGFKAPVMLPCGHSFCSLCIRR